LTRINLGCNRWKLAGFVNLDIDPAVQPDQVCDVAHLHYGDETVDEIYAGHMLEHFHFKDRDAVLQEWRRVLVQGGRITVTVPDIEKGIEEQRRSAITEEWLQQIAFGSIDYGGHWQVFTAKTILALMGRHFQDVDELETCPYVVAAVRWQTIVTGVKGGFPQPEKVSANAPRNLNPLKFDL